MPKTNQEKMNSLVFDDINEYNRYLADLATTDIDTSMALNKEITDISDVKVSVTNNDYNSNAENHDSYTEYIPYMNMLPAIIGNKPELYDIVDSIIDEDPKFGRLLPCLVQTLYQYHITGEKLQKLWEISCNQNTDIFKLTLFLLNSFQYNQSLAKYIEQNLEQDEPMSFIENPTIEKCQTILEDTENWEKFCIAQAEYIKELSKQEKSFTR